MQLDDRTSIRTPEGVELELTLAGLGSRFGAALLDSVVVGVLLLLAVFGISALGSAVADDLALLLVGTVSLTVFAILVGYFVLFEVVNGGRTPGKAAFGLRVVASSGEPVGFWGSLVRNLVRVVDFLPGFYAAGAVSILVTRHNQRLGDIAARTIVVRDRIAAAPGHAPPTPAAGEQPGWDVSAITPEETALVRRFLERRSALAPARREELAAQIAAGLRPKVGGVERRYPDEEFLARMLSEKLARGSPG